MTKVTSYIGLLVFIISLTYGYIYIQMPDAGVQIKVDKTETIFYVDEGRWIISGIEYNKLFNGTKLVYRHTKDIKITNMTLGDYIFIKRESTYYSGTKIIDQYVFDHTLSDVELFPIKHTITIINGSGLIYQYEVRRLEYIGETIKGINSPQSFGKSMKIEWDKVPYYSKIYKYFYKDEGKLTLKYRIKTDYETFNIRLFDPPKTADDFFVKLIDNKADFMSGYGIFDFYNPTDKDIIINNETLGAFFNVVKGEIKSYDYEILGTVENDVIIILDKAKKTKQESYEDCNYTYKNKTTYVVDNITNEVTEHITTVIDKKTCETKYKTVDYVEQLKLKNMGNITVEKKKTIRIKITANYKPNTVVDWQPTMIVEGIIFKQQKW